MSAFVPTNGMGLLIGLLFALLELTEGRKALIYIYNPRPTTTTTRTNLMDTPTAPMPTTVKMASQTFISDLCADRMLELAFFGYFIGTHFCQG
jgi:hypothetical protein